MSTVKSLLAKLNLGTSVAEFDEDLESYFVETNVFHELVNDQKDLVAGDKGTGKTAIYRFVNKRQSDIPSLAQVTIIPAFNFDGSPVFSALTEQEKLEDSQYKELWKTYILSLVGNTLINNNPELKNSVLDGLLVGLKLRTPTPEPKSVFRAILRRVPNFLHWDSAEMALTLSETGVPVLTPKIVFSKQNPEIVSDTKVSIDEALMLLDELLSEHNTRVWVTFDRLDEAFHGFADIEVAALRGLLRTYLDLAGLANLRIKLFLRRDLFRRITEGGFVNLTHVNSRKIEIVWDEDDLLNLLAERIRKNPEFVEGLGLSKLSDKGIFDRIFPDQVDFGKRKPKTWVWIMRRVRDGNDVKPPRNLIDLIKFAREEQMRKEEREPREVGKGTVIEAEALRRGLSRLSKERVNDTLLAESGTYSSLIEKFRDGKAEHNIESLANVLEIPLRDVRGIIKPLIEIGFLEDIRGTYKIPTLYREGLNITQGKAFAGDEPDESDDD